MGHDIGEDDIPDDRLDDQGQIEQRSNRMAPEAFAPAAQKLTGLFMLIVDPPNLQNLMASFPFFPFFSASVIILIFSPHWRSPYSHEGLSAAVHGKDSQFTHCILGRYAVIRNGQKS